jgi:hypothetical protein
VPPEFQVQYPHYANPPTLILPLLSIIDHIRDEQKSNQSLIFGTATNAMTIAIFLLMFRSDARHGCHGDG